MARISGVDLPRTKRIEIGLTYIFGIGRHRSNVVLAAAGVDPSVRVKDLTEDDVRKITRVLEEQGGIERSPQGNLAQHQAADRDRQLPRRPASPQPAAARAAHQDQRAHAEGPAQGRRGQEEDGVTHHGKSRDSRRHRRGSAD